MTDTVDIVKVKGVKRATFGLILSFSALVMAGYLYYQDLKAHARATYQIQSLDNFTASNIQKLQQDANSLNTQVNQLKTKVDAVTNDRFSANNYQLNTLISLANQNLIAYHDVNAAVKLLQYAQNVVASNNSPMYTELKVALTTDLGRLSQLPVIDRVVIATKLNNIVDETDHLELLVPDRQLTSALPGAQPVSGWKKFSQNVQAKLLGLIQVSDASKNDALNLLPQHEAIIHQNIKLDILNARMALLQSDEASWLYSLAQAKQSLMAYFIHSNPMNGVIQQIEELQQMNVSASGNTIDATLNALNKLNNLEK